MDLKNFLKQTSRGKELTEYQFNLLAKNDIETVQEFLKADLPKLQVLLDIKKPHSVYDIKVELIDLLGREKKCTFATLYEEEKQNNLDHGTGIEELDKLLGAIKQPFPRVWEIYGEAGVGKTEMMYTFAINFVCQQRERPRTVLFIDCKGDFDAERILQILQELKYPQQEEAMKAIKVVNVFSDEHIIAVLQALLKQRLENLEEASSIGLLLIDCLPACFLHFRSKNERMLANAQLTSVASLLRRLNTGGVGCIVGNASFARDELGKIVEEQGDIISEDSGGTGPYEPLLGLYWKSVCTLRMSLELPNPEDDDCNIDTVVDDGLRVLNVINNTYGPAGGSCHLCVSQAGIV
ncbi:DNA repair protein RAD51 homolog 4 [Drosophila tropicalis]|uniref:DNA repair protein RAD51 homolog 4 n=1 Tax=Drosophila tropicalis TaxID=46794 RepID=UPI0035ABD197